LSKLWNRLILFRKKVFASLDYTIKKSPDWSIKVHLG
jgi:hypothetical protein